MKVHTCFPGCKTTADCLIGGNFKIDSGAWCVMPENSVCETLIESGQMCFDKEKKICLSFYYMIYSIIIMNVL